MIILRVLSIYCIFNLALFILLWAALGKEWRDDLATKIPDETLAMIRFIIFTAFSTIPISVRTLIVRIIRRQRDRISLSFSLSPDNEVENEVIERNGIRVTREDLSLKDVAMIDAYERACIELEGKK